MHAMRSVLFRCDQPASESPVLDLGVGGFNPLCKQPLRVQDSSVSINTQMHKLRPNSNKILVGSRKNITLTPPLVSSQIKYCDLLMMRVIQESNLE